MVRAPISERQTVKRVNKTLQNRLCGSFWSRHRLGWPPEDAASSSYARTTQKTREVLRAEILSVLATLAVRIVAYGEH
jgi:hypothetical protein